MREIGQTPVGMKVLRFRIKRDLKREAARINLSQNRLATLCGVSSGYMSQLLSRQRCVGPAVRGRLLETFPGLSFDELFEEVRE